MLVSERDGEGRSFSFLLIWLGFWESWIACTWVDIDGPLQYVGLVLTLPRLFLAFFLAGLVKKNTEKQEKQKLFEYKTLVLKIKVRSTRG